MILLLAPTGFPGKFLGAFWLLPILLFKPPTPPLGEIKFTLLDVGQGLSAVVQTQNHALVYDAGPRLGDSFDMGASVVMPYLRTQGIKKLDLLVISHGDNDHSGGAQAILQQLSVAELKTSVPELFPNTKASYCLANTSWVWDEVHFEFIYPDKEQLGLGNDSSCVLRVSAGKHHILLAGDIEKEAEYYLLAQDLDFSADIFVAPHHGSKTSGLREFIERVNPKIVLYAIGYRNRYHFPHVSVVKTYQDLQITQLDTVNTGAIQFQITNKTISKPVSYRQTTQKYWN